MKKRLRTADLKFIRDLVAEVYNSQSDMRRALTSNDLAAVLREINLSEYFKDDEYLQGGY